MSNWNMKKFGEKLRTLRKQHKLSQTELGNMLGVVHSHIGGMERGERSPSVAMLFKITQIFNVSADVLINDELELGE